MNADNDDDANEFWQAAAGRQSLSTLLSEQIVRRWHEKEQREEQNGRQVQVQVSHRRQVDREADRLSRWTTPRPTNGPSNNILS